MRLAPTMLLAAAFAAGSYADTVAIDGYAAVVNDRVITVGDVMSAIQPIEAQLRDAYSGVELEAKREEAFTKGLQMLVDEALIVEEFKKQGGQIPDRMISDRINEIIIKRFGNDRALFLQTLAEEQITIDDWQDDIRDKLIVQVMRRQEVFDKVRLSPAKVREAYDARIASFSVPERVELGVIVLHKGETEEDREAKREQAVLTQGKLLAGDDFAAVAREVSEGAKASEGGDWGWMAPDTLRPELRDAVEGLQPGEFSDVIEADDAFYILKVHARESARVKSFEEVHHDIEDELKDQESERLYKEWMQRLSQKHFVEVRKDARP
jgi:peptidyl-prolyl cis-trans isomerase SurA